METYILDSDGLWVKGEPSEGEKFRMYTASGSYVEKVHTGQNTIPKKRKVTRREFWQRVTDDVYANILSISSSSNLWLARLDMINSDQNVWLDSPEYQAWFAELVADGVISQEQLNYIFNGE